MLLKLPITFYVFIFFFKFELDFFSVNLKIQERVSNNFIHTINIFRTLFSHDIFKNLKQCMDNLCYIMIIFELIHLSKSHSSLNKWNSMSVFPQNIGIGLINIDTWVIRIRFELEFD